MRVHVVVLLAVLTAAAVGGFFVWRSSADAAGGTALPTDRSGAPTASDGSRGTPADLQSAPERRRGAKTTSADDAPRSSGELAASVPEPPPAPPPEPEPTPITLTLDVRSAVDSSAIPGFRWRFDTQTISERGEALFGVAELALPAGASGRLLVEAAGMQPFSRENVTIPHAADGPARLEIFLTPTAQAEGIKLLVRDLDRAPVQHVQVSAFVLNAENRDTAWQLGKPLWTRATSAEDGSYSLPPMPQGSYGVRLVATNESGDLLPLQAFRRVFELSGSNGYLEDVTLEPGCNLRIELLDGSGRPFDAKAASNGIRGDGATGRGVGGAGVELRLNRPGESGSKREWSALLAVGHQGIARATNRIPSNGPIWLSEPIAPGTYLFEVVVDGTTRLSQSLQLLPQTQTERLTVY
ncbi:MAG: hypothetical protein AB8H80_07325 [Planctomycetota bacterium]